jgi:ABC-2 type transport system permease protein
VIGAVGTELLKLRTVRSSWLLLAAGQAIVLAGISGLVVSGGDLKLASTQGAAVAHVGLASLCALILGILLVAGEYRHQTVVDTYLSTPARGRVIGAKLVAAAATGTLFGLAGAVTAELTGWLWWQAKGESFGLTDGVVLRTLAGGVAWNLLFAALGVGVGALIRNVGGAIAVALAWIALVEGIVAQLVGTGLTRWLPFEAGQALGLTGVGGVTLLPQWGAALVLAGYAAALAGVAVRTTVRRDVT